MMQLKVLLPGILALGMCLDIGLRFVPDACFGFRLWQIIHHFPPKDGMFTPGVVHRDDHTYGDLAWMANLPLPFRRYHAETVTIDEFGYRNVPSVAASRSIDAIVIGDSYALGNGVNDDETFAAKLSAETQLTVYNGADLSPQLSRIQAIAHRYRMHHGLVLYEYLERQDLPTCAIPSLQTQVKEQIKSRINGMDTTRYLYGLKRISPVRLLAERAFQKIANGTVLPNPLEKSVVKKTLINGETILFLPEEIRKTYEQRPVNAGYWTCLAKELQKDNLELAVVLVPNKYTVYRSFLREQEPPLPAGRPYLEQLEAALQAAGIPAVNVLNVMCHAAVEGFQQGKYIYFLDDTHWNAHGIITAAREAAPKLFTSRKYPLRSDGRMY
jgi:hypothetical protein